MGSPSSDLTSCLKRFIWGTAAWTVGALVLSAFEWGRSATRLYTLVLLGVALGCGASTPFTVILARRFGEASARDRIAALFLLMLLITQFARSTTGPTMIPRGMGCVRNRSSWATTRYSAA